MTDVHFWSIERMDTKKDGKKTCIIWVVPPPSNSGNEGLEGFPTKNVIILVVTLTGRGDNPMYHFEYLAVIFFLGCKILKLITA